MADNMEGGDPVASALRYYHDHPGDAYAMPEHQPSVTSYGPVRSLANRLLGNKAVNTAVSAAEAGKDMVPSYHLAHGIGTGDTGEIAHGALLAALPYGLGKAAQLGRGVEAARTAEALRNEQPGWSALQAQMQGTGGIRDLLAAPRGSVQPTIDSLSDLIRAKQSGAVGRDNYHQALEAFNFRDRPWLSPEAWGGRNPQFNAGPLGGEYYDYMLGLDPYYVQRALWRGAGKTAGGAFGAGGIYGLGETLDYHRQHHYGLGPYDEGLAYKDREPVEVAHSEPEQPAASSSKASSAGKADKDGADDSERNWFAQNAYEQSSKWHDKASDLSLTAGVTGLMGVMPRVMASEMPWPVRWAANAWAVPTVGFALGSPLAYMGMSDRADKAQAAGDAWKRTGLPEKPQQPEDVLDTFYP